MIMAKRSITFSLLFAMTAAFADMAHAGRASVEFLAHNLNLDDDQRAKVEVIMADQYSVHKLLRKEGRANCENKHQMWSDTLERMNGVLNAEQLKTFEKIQERRQRSCAGQIRKMAASQTNQPL